MSIFTFGLGNKDFLLTLLIFQEIVDVTEEYNRDRRDLELTQEELLKELKLKYLLIENFIPVEDKEKILARARYDEEEDVWRLGGSRPASGNIYLYVYLYYILLAVLPFRSRTLTPSQSLAGP